MCILTSFHRQRTFLGVERLIKLGHKRIGTITWQKKISTTQERIQGYLEAFEKYGQDTNKSVLVKEKGTAEGVMEAAEALLKLEATLTAIFTASNLISLAVLLTLKRLSKKIPEEVSLVGFNDVEWGEALDPPITAVSQPAYAIGTTSDQLLMRRLFHDGSKEKQKIELRTSLIIRRSCGSILNDNTGRLNI